DGVRAKAPKLPDSLVVKVPSRLPRSDRPPESRCEAVPKFRGPSAIECRVLTILAQIIRVERNTMAPGPCGIEPPECALMVGNIVEESRLVEVRAGRESVDVPSACFASDFDTVKALSNVRPFTNREKPARTVIQLLPADT